jgi:hypothetical protein
VSGVSPFFRDGRPDDPAVIAEIASMVREAMELRAVEAADAAQPVSEPLASEGAELNGRAPAEDYPRLEVPRGDPEPKYQDLRADALSLNDYRNAPRRVGANETERPSWFSRTFRRTN